MVAVIVVIFQTQEVRVQRLQNVELIVVDNTPSQDLGLSGPHLHYLPLGANHGIAYAQNRGLELAREIGCSHVVFFDHDSEPEADYVTRISAAYQEIRAEHPNLFILGPRMEEKTTGKEYRSAVHHYETEDCGFSPRPSVISSGSCLSLEAVSKVGGLCEQLFIDYVDHEWCFRASKLGLVSGITDRITLKHQVGLKMKSFLGAKIFISQPFRYFYIYRNYLWLSRLGYVPRSWKLSSGLKLILGLVQSPFLTGQFRATVANQWRGLRAGVRKPSKPLCP